MISLYAKQIKRIFYPEFFLWILRGFESPSPSFVKLNVLKCHAPVESHWIETGTYLGETSKRLSKFALTVKTLEPDPNLYNFASKRLKKLKNVTVFQGSSETHLEDILVGTSGNICFWLDGHFSGDVTFRGQSETPILVELGIIERNLSKFSKIVIFVDDVREFVNKNRSGKYPKLDELVNFASNLNFEWTIEHDIFICWN